jgi:hypothetical protein
MRNHAYIENYDMVMNLSQAMLVGRSLEDFFNEQRAQETKKQNTQGEGTNGVHFATSL